MFCAQRWRHPWQKCLRFWTWLSDSGHPLRGLARKQVKIMHKTCTAWWTLFVQGVTKKVIKIWTPFYDPRVKIKSKSCTNPEVCARRWVPAVTFLHEVGTPSDTPGQKSSQNTAQTRAEVSRGWSDPRKLSKIGSFLDHYTGPCHACHCTTVAMPATVPL